MARLPNPFPGISTTTVTTTTTQKKFGKGVAAGYNGTLVAFIMDESGSMASHWDATMGGFNEFINGQKQAEGACHVMVNKFDGGEVRDLWGKLDIEKVPEMTAELYRPRGSTNLNDAIGETVEQIDQYLKTMKKKERPAVLIVIMTDGEENSSRKFTKDDIKELVALREKKDWGFTFIGADIDAFSAGMSYGMNASNTMQYSKGATLDAFASVSASTARFRSAKLGGMDTQTLYASGMYTAEERNKSNGGE